MNLDQLTDAELLVFVGLAKLVIRADKIVSDDEKGWLSITAEAVGKQRWSDTIRGAQGVFDSTEAVRQGARDIDRADARAAIYASLMELAGSDGYVFEEARIMDWLARAWEMGDHIPSKR